MPSLTPTQLNTHADEYDGKKVQVIGWLVYDFEDIGIWDSANAHDNPPRQEDPQNCVSYSGPELGSEYEDQFVVLRGIFRKRIHPGMISNADCNDSGLEVEGHPLGR